MFLRNGDLIFSQPMNGVNFQRAHWDAAAGRFVHDGEVPIRRHGPWAQTRTGVGGAAAAVNQPVDRDAFGAKIYVVACPWPSGEIYTGLSPSAFEPFRWEFAAELPLAADDAITALGSATSEIVFAGTLHGRLFRLDTRNESFGEMRMEPAAAPDHIVSQICVVDDVGLRTRSTRTTPTIAAPSCGCPATSGVRWPACPIGRSSASTSTGRNGRPPSSPAPTMPCS